MRRQLVPDFETVSSADIQKAGADAYAEHPTTGVLCLSIKDVKTGQRWRWYPWEPTDELSALASDPDILWIAHNVRFERAVWREHMVKIYGLPSIPLERWYDTMATAAMKTQPLALDRLAKALDLPVQKDMDGSGFTIGLSKPNRKGYYPTLDTAAYKRAGDYCDIDVDTQVLAHKALGWITPEEHKVWLLDQTINDRGVPIDRGFVEAAHQIVTEAKAPLLKEYKDIVGVNLTQRDKSLQWFHSNGLSIPNTQKTTIDSVLGGDEHGWDEEVDWDLLALDLQPDVERALRIRQLIASTSISKLETMQQCVCSDGCAHGLLQYHGAGTGRWAGRLLQPQNFPRGSIDVGSWMDGNEKAELLVNAIKSRDYRYVQANIGPPVETVVSSLRHSIVAGVDRLLLVGDFAAIEARIVLALAGQHDKTALMASGADVYCDVASLIFGHLVTKALVEERQIGKNTVLGCGFGMGWRKFQLRYARHHDHAFCEGVINTYRKEWAPLVPLLWKGIEKAAVDTVFTGQPHEAYGVLFQLEPGQDYLTARLPSGRKLWYSHPRGHTYPAPWSTEEEPQTLRGWTYIARKNGHSVVVKAYGGLLVENIVQALARDLMVHAMFLCEAENLPVILTVHDEIVTNPEARRADPVTLKQIMEHLPSWAIAMRIPVAAETWAGPRYRK